MTEQKKPDNISDDELDAVQGGFGTWNTTSTTGVKGPNAPGATIAPDANVDGGGNFLDRAQGRQATIDPNAD